MMSACSHRINDHGIVIARPNDFIMDMSKARELYSKGNLCHHGLWTNLSYQLLISIDYEDSSRYEYIERVIIISSFCTLDKEKLQDESSLKVNGELSYSLPLGSILGSFTY